MHAYAIDGNERARVYLVVGAVSLAAWYGIRTVAEDNWIPAVSFFVVTGVLLTFIDRWLWKWRWGPLKMVFNIPDLSGSWSGSVSSSFGPDESLTDYPVELELRQSWRSIRLILTTETSSSATTSASFQTKCLTRPRLSYVFRSEPYANAPKSMSIHDGAALVEYFSENDELIGHYFTGRGRETYGMLTLKRKV